MSQELLTDAEKQHQSEADQARIIAARTEERAQPGNGYLVLSKPEFLKALGFKDDLDILGVRWTKNELKVALRGEAIHWQGGQIMKTNPVMTNKQRDGRSL